MSSPHSLHAFLCNRTFTTGTRHGPSISFRPAGEDLRYTASGILHNDPNVRTGTCLFVGRADGTATLVSAGPAAVSKAAGMNYAIRTALGQFPLEVRLLDGGKVEFESASLADDEEDRKAVLVVFDAPPKAVADIGKGVLTSPDGEKFSQHVAWITEGEGVKDGKAAAFDGRLVDDDTTGLKFQWRDADGAAGRFSETVFGQTAGAGWQRGDGSSDGTTVAFQLGDKTLEFRVGHEKVTIPKGWGPTELEVPILASADGKMAIRVLGKQLSRPVIEQYTT
ncbi:hypothetical protein DFJ74DRAFT_660297 [Hyaloraphidium curvatum]|nr:hypothetical protein DFJ74DRAFT_660297 [Hyaloraphidium curvatum]